MSDDLNAFLDKAEDEPAAAPEAPPAEAAAPEAPAEAAPPEADADPEPEAADEAGIRKALAAERDKRRDWKEKAIRAEGEMAELRRQLEAARQPQQQPAQPQEQQYQPIDPSVDPQGYVQRVQQVAISTKLDMSEMMLRKEIGGEKVDALIAEFKEAAKEDPALFTRLYAQQHPYEWAHQQIEARKLQREIGTDPNAYKAKLEAEFRAKWEAERGEQPLTVPTRSPAAGLPPSLANARNAAPRSTAAFNGPPPLQDVFPS